MCRGSAGITKIFGLGQKKDGQAMPSGSTTVNFTTKKQRLVYTVESVEQKSLKGSRRV
jgi:hypothetical protein